MKIKIVHLSDTHNRHNELIVPDGDIVIHSGDYTIAGQGGTLNFLSWFACLPHQHKFFVCGNHESGKPPQVDGVKYIEGCCETINFFGKDLTIAGLYAADKLYSGGSPMFIDSIKDVDILVSHCPPEGVLSGKPGDGSQMLRVEVEAINPKLHLFGHIHSCNGIFNGTKIHLQTIFVNGSQDHQPQNGIRSTKRLRDCRVIELEI